METSCGSGCPAIYKCSCGVLLCDHLITNHIMQRHSVSPLPGKATLDEAFEVISQKKKEIIQATELVFSELIKATLGRD